MDKQSGSAGGKAGPNAYENRPKRRLEKEQLRFPLQPA